MVKILLHLEGLGLFLACLFFYYMSQYSWLLFIALFLLPDISMIGYLKNKKLGATLYNLIHNYLIGLFIFMLGLLFGSNLLLSVGIILIAHVAFDRFLGYGLKYPTSFKTTHLQKLD